MEDARRPIAVFDSGVGGISVLRALVDLMPNENYIYYGDSLHAPYGSKTLEEVRALTEMHVNHLLEAGAKAVVVACNTATSADISILRERYPHIPMIGIEPAVKPAVESRKHPGVLVLATPMTIRETKFQTLLKRYENEADIYPLPCPGLVEYIEQGELSGPSLEGFLEKLLAPYRYPAVDCVVLGCTHYPFVAGAIKKILGEEVAVFEGGPGTARETRRRLRERGLVNPSAQRGFIRFENSLDTQEELKLCQMLLNSKENIKQFKTKF